MARKRPKRLPTDGLTRREMQRESIEASDFTISFQELQDLYRVSNPTAREAIRRQLEELEESDLTIEELNERTFNRPSYDRGDGSEVLVGRGLASEYEKEAEESLEDKGVSPSGGGGGGGGGGGWSGGGYSEDITSDQWQRIRNGEIEQWEAEWENDPENYDPETGEMYDYGFYPEDLDEDEF